MLGPDFVTPEAPVAPQWQEHEEKGIKKQDGEKAVKERIDDYSQWWKVFGDPVLDKLVQTAYEQNLSLQIAGLRVLEARAQLGIAAGNLYPQNQEMTGDYSYNRGSNTAPWVDRYFSSASVGFDAAWELDFWGKFRRGIQSADASLLANIASYDDVLVTLTAEVARTYVQIRTFEERVRLARENAEIQDKALQLTTAQFEEGAVTALDMQQAKTSLRNTQASIPGFQISLRQSQHALSILMGMPPQDLAELLGDPAGIPTAPTEVAVGIPADLLRRRPDIKQAELEAAAQSAQIGIARSELFPSFALLGTLGWSVNDAAQNSMGDLFNSRSFGFSLGPSFQWNIFNYGRLKNQVRVQDARFEQALTNYRNVVLNAAGEVEDAMVGFLQSKAKAKYLLEGSEAAKISSDLSMLQYKEGMTSYQRVLDSNRALTQQQDNYAQTRGDIVTNLIAMYKALGGGWQVRLGNDFVPAPVQVKMKDRTDWGELLEIRNEKPPDLDSEKELWRNPDW
ncbi:MAG: efflux transporter outer membrane subunit [Deltaproteobacteria bacterium]|nr:efflux transporter outer membrane subunit [Deltaproteobacteria bacterium]